MGCCEARGHKKDPKTNFEGSDESDNFSVSSVDDSDSLSRMEMIELKENKPLLLLDKYLNYLLNQTTWVTQINKKEIIIKSINKSIFTNNIPIILGYVNLEQKIPHSILRNLLEADQTWDQNLISSEVISQAKDYQILRIVKKFPIKNRFFIVRRYFYEKSGSLNYLSVNEDFFEEDQGLERGWYHFSLVKIKDHNGKTYVSHLFQIDNVQESNIYLNYISGNELFEWLQKLKSKAIKLNN